MPYVVLVYPMLGLGCWQFGGDFVSSSHNVSLTPYTRYTRCAQSPYSTCSSLVTGQHTSICRRWLYVLVLIPARGGQLLLVGGLVVG